MAAKTPRVADGDDGKVCTSFRDAVGRQLEEKDSESTDDAREELQIREDTQLESLIALSSAVDSLSVLEQTRQE